LGLTKLIDTSLLERFKNKIISLIPTRYADSPSAGGPAKIANGIHYAQVDSTSTATAFTVQIPGITEYYDGLTILLKNGVVTSATNFTIDVNGLGAKGSYSNLAAATRDTTLFNINYTMMFVYDSSRVSGGCWICYRGYDANTNTIGYQVRSNSYSLPMDSIVYRYRLLFTSADGSKFVPANNSTSTNATAARAVCQSKIDPFGEIVYYGTTASVAANSRPASANLWQQYILSLGYSFNVDGRELALTAWKPVYLKCSPQTDGSAIIDSAIPIVQDLPSTDDGKIYIFLGVAYSATNIELLINHPVYCYRNGKIELWTGVSVYEKPSGGIPKTDLASAVQTSLGKADTALQPEDAPQPSDDTPSYVNTQGVGDPGTSTDYARADHVHNFDTAAFESMLEFLDSVNIPVILTDAATGAVLIQQSPSALAGEYVSQVKVNFALVIPPDTTNYPVLFTASKFSSAGELHLTGIVDGVLYEAVLTPGADPYGSSNTVMVGTMTTTNLVLPSAQGVSF